MVKKKLQNVPYTQLDKQATQQNLVMTHREEPTTRWQKFDNSMQDFWNRFLKRYWWLWLIVIVIPLLITFFVLLSKSATAKEALGSLFQALGKFLAILFGRIFGLNIIICIIAFLLTLYVATKLMHKERIMLEGFSGKGLEVLTMKETEDETIIYQNRDTLLSTLFKGQIKIHIDRDTWNYLINVGEKKEMKMDRSKYDLLKVYLMPEEKMRGEKKFIQLDNGDWTINSLYLMRNNNLEEYIIKSNIPGVNAEELRETLVNATLEINELREYVVEYKKNVRINDHRRVMAIHNKTHRPGSYDERYLDSLINQREGITNQEKNYLRMIKPSPIDGEAEEEELELDQEQVIEE